MIVPSEMWHFLSLLSGHNTTNEFWYSTSLAPVLAHLAQNNNIINLHNLPTVNNNC